MSYPWSELGIDPTSDTATIRKAYATKLKVTRPDEDPAGFQRLVEARDAALKRASVSIGVAATAARLTMATDPSKPRAKSEVASIETTSPVLHDDEPGEIRIGFADKPLRSQPANAHDDAPLARSKLSIDFREGFGQAPSASNEDKPLEAETSGDRARSVSIADIHVSTDFAEEFERALEKIGENLPWDSVTRQWANVFDCVENAPLTHSHSFLARALDKLAGDLLEKKGPLPRVKANDRAGRQIVLNTLGEYTDVLRELEKRYQFSRRDRSLFEYLAIEKVENLANGLDAVVDRNRPVNGNPRKRDAVPDIDRRFIEAAFAGEPDMAEFYERACAEGCYPMSISIPAWFIPTLFAARYKLTELAVALNVCVVTFIAALIGGKPLLQQHIGSARFGDIVVLVAFAYMLFQGGLAMSIKEMRLKRMLKCLDRLSRDGLPAEQICETLGACCRPSWPGTIIGLIPLLLFAAVVWH